MVELNSISEWGNVLLEIPVGETVYVKWHSRSGLSPPNEPSEFTGVIVEHGLWSTEILNKQGQHLYMFRGNMLLDVNWIES